MKQLMKSFQAKQYPDNDEITQLAESLNTTRRRVGDWFYYMQGRKIAEGMLPESK